MKSITIYVNDSYKRIDGKSPVYLRVRINEKYIKESLNVFILPDQFDKKNGLLKKSVKDAEQLNMIIREKVSKANKIFIKYELSKVELTATAFRSEFNRETENIDFLEWIRTKIQERFKHNEISKSTYSHDLSIVNVLEKFKPVILFSDIDEKLIKDFRRFVAKACKHNTVVKDLVRLKVYLRIAANEKIITENDFFRFENLTEEEIEPGWLTEEQKDVLVKAYNTNMLYDIISKTDYYVNRDDVFARNQQISYQKVIRWFLFSCETGLRISDLMDISFEDVHEGILVFSPVKTRRTKLREKTVRVPLTRLAKQLIKDEKPFGLKGKIFSTFAEQVINRHLKAIFNMLKIELNNGTVHFHCARHTFGSLLYKKTKNLVLVQKMMGHAKIEQTMVYVRLHPEEMFREFLEKFSG